MMNNLPTVDEFWNALIDASGTAENSITIYSIGKRQVRLALALLAYDMKDKKVTRGASDAFFNDGPGP